MALMEKYTYTCEEHHDRVNNKVFFVCANLIVKVFLNVFGLKNRQCCLKDDNEKGKRSWGCCWDKLSKSGLMGMVELEDFMHLIIWIISC